MNVIRGNLPDKGKETHHEITLAAKWRKGNKMDTRMMNGPRTKKINKVRVENCLRMRSRQTRRSPLKGGKLRRGKEKKAHQKLRLMILEKKAHRNLRCLILRKKTNQKLEYRILIMTVHQKQA